MTKGPKPLVGLCALLVWCLGCSTEDGGSEMPAAAGAVNMNAGAGAGARSSGEADGAAPNGGESSGAGTSTGGNGGGLGGDGSTAASGGAANTPPPAVEGLSVYALECRGESRDCAGGEVPCFGVSSETPNVAAGWACANRCASNADCSDAPSGADARARCVSFTAAGHCMLVCRDEDQTFACPGGMQCYVPPRSPIGYCLWTE